MAWTNEQQAAIDSRGQTLLLSAAAGSGKTAVLVERIIRRLLDKEYPIDITELLVVTFTKAAAAEMRDRIGTALMKALSETKDPASNASWPYCHRPRFRRSMLFVSMSSVSISIPSTWIRLFPLPVKKN